MMSKISKYAKVVSMNGDVSKHEISRDDIEKSVKTYEKLINKIGPKNILQYMAPQAAGTGLKGRGRSN